MNENKVFVDVENITTKEDIEKYHRDYQFPKLAFFCRVLLIRFGYKVDQI